MKVICIDDMGEDGHKLQITAGEVYTASLSSRKGYYIIHEHRKYRNEPVCYEQSRFIPLSEIDEMELVNQKLQSA